MDSLNVRGDSIKTQLRNQLFEETRGCNEYFPYCSPHIFMVPVGVFVFILINSSYFW